MKKYVILVIFTNAGIVVQFSQVSNPSSYLGIALVCKIRNLSWNTLILILIYNSKLDLLNFVTRIFFLSEKLIIILSVF
jgi:hypothetical protein